MTEVTPTPPVPHGKPSPILLVFLIIPIFGIIAAVALAINDGAFGGQVAPTPEAVSSDFVSLVGQPAPDFSLTGLDGAKHQLTEYKGRVTFVNFWATWCGPCAIEMPALEQVYRKYQDQGLVVLGINQGEAGERVTQYLRNNNLSFPSVLDTETSIARQYRVTGYPTTWLVDADGTLRQVRRGAFLDVSQVERMVADVVARQ